MARDPAGHETVRESVLDRLLDDHPEQHREVQSTRDEALRRLTLAVRRDLEWLLGTRLTWVDDALLATEHASRSVVTYGLQDYSHENLGNTDAQQRLRRAIEQAIVLFEPRLTRVVVTSEAPDPTQRALRFRIDGILDVAPVRAPVSFDTVMEMNGQTQVTEA